MTKARGRIYINGNLAWSMMGERDTIEGNLDLLDALFSNMPGIMDYDLILELEEEKPIIVGGPWK